ncbi:MAG: hypothetical protein NC102_08785 [Clostridium sp.]|nr:hypothetical protein [Clostridium sp.]
MSKIQHDIEDDEIRVISAEGKSKPGEPGIARKRRNWAFAAAAGIAAALIICALLGLFGAGDDEELELAEIEEAASIETPEPMAEAPGAIPAAEAGYVEISDTLVNGMRLTVFTPMNLTPSLEIGVEALADTTAKFVVQAADIRKDNGGIVGAFVNAGNLVSKGRTKPGFCAIVGGKMTIGVAESTPYLEQAIENDGYFFRQYPLVVGNQVVENKPRGKSLRKALAELDGRHVVIMSRREMTFRDFSQTLVDMGVSNAIYLVGSASNGFAIGRNGEKTEIGKRGMHAPENTNYLVWR